MKIGWALRCNNSHCLTGAASESLGIRGILCLRGVRSVCHPGWLLWVLLISCHSKGESVREKIAEGLTYYRLEESTPNVVHVLEVDLSTPRLHVRPAKAGNRLRATQTLSEIVSHGDSVLAAINGDFFSQEGIPSGAMAVDGQVVKHASPGWWTFGLTKNGDAFFDTLDGSGRVTLPDRTVIELSGVNRPRGDDEWIWYNSFFGPSTGTNVYGVEVIVRPVPQRAGDHEFFEVIQIDTSIGDHPLNDSTCVLSFHTPAKKSPASRFAVGMKIRLQMTPYSDAAFAIGGFPLLVEKGRKKVHPQEPTSFYQDRYARTAVGYNKHWRKLLLVCVDGGQPNYSLGMSLDELAGLMVRLGAEEAVNLDGGGSTTMIVRRRLINRPSTGLERPISNAIVVTAQ